MVPSVPPGYHQGTAGVPPGYHRLPLVGCVWRALHLPATHHACCHLPRPAAPTSLTAVCCLHAHAVCLPFFRRHRRVPPGSASHQLQLRSAGGGKHERKKVCAHGRGLRGPGGKDVLPPAPPQGHMWGGTLPAKVVGRRWAQGRRAGGRKGGTLRLQGAGQGPGKGAGRGVPAGQGHGCSNLAQPPAQPPCTRLCSTTLLHHPAHPPAPLPCRALPPLTALGPW